MIAGFDYLDDGRRGETVVCLHGIGGGAASFAAWLGKLPGFRIIAVDLPGYGDSAALAEPSTFAGLSEQLAGFIAELGAGAVHLAGHSIGGMIALEHALRRADQVKSLALIGTTPAFGGRDDSFKEAFLKARLAPLEAGQNMGELAREAAPHLVGPMAGTEVVDEIANIMSKVPETTWRDNLKCLVTFNRRSDLGRVAHRCCLIGGSEDRNAPAKTMQKMANSLANAEIHILDKIGHMFPQEAPDECLRILSKFLERPT